jgi:hypothetical protein
MLKHLNRFGRGEQRVWLTEGTDQIIALRILCQKVREPVPVGI